MEGNVGGEVMAAWNNGRCTNNLTQSGPCPIHVKSLGTRVVNICLLETHLNDPMRNRHSFQVLSSHRVLIERRKQSVEVLEKMTKAEILKSYMLPYT